MMIGLFLNAQVILNYDFEAYTVGGKLAQQAGLPWTTWSGATGNSEDPVISGDQHVSGTKSVKVVTNNDAVLKLGDKTQGRYEYSLQFRPVANKIGYFNVLQDFAGNNSKWGLQVYFLGNGTGKADANGDGAVQFTYQNDTWMPIKIIIDLDDDYATMYMNGEEKVSYKWTLGTFGTPGPKKISAGNFYGHTQDGKPGEYFLDDIKFEQVTAPLPPQNLKATYDGTNTIKLTWDKPTGATPVSYSITRNGAVYKTGITTNSYDDVLETPPYPDTYVYSIRAEYDNAGYSAASNEASATIEGGVERELVLFEFATGVWCQYCPGAAMGAAELEANGKEVAILKYHASNGDPYEIPAGIARLQYYQIESFPTAKVDGVLEVVGGNATTSLYPAYLPLYEKRIAKPATMTLDLNMVALTPDIYTASVTLEKTYDYFKNDVFIFGALTESHIQHAWQGQSELNNVVRAMYPETGAGNIVSFPSGSNKLTFDYEISTTGFNTDNCEFVVFAQHMPTKEIIQVAKKALKTVSVDAKQNVSLNIYPNPTSSVLNIETSSAKPITYTITNLQGKVLVPTTVLNEKTDIDVSKWTNGIYILKTNTGTVKKFSVISR